ncbi:hypothetical protein GP486_008464, partial [Trichoglossum hirsutum]
MENRNTNTGTNSPSLPGRHSRQQSLDERRRGPSTPPPPPSQPPASNNVQTPLSPSNPEAATAAGVDHLARDFGYLLKPEIYHPLTQL